LFDNLGTIQDFSGLRGGGERAGRHRRRRLFETPARAVMIEFEKFGAKLADRFRTRHNNAKARISTGAIGAGAAQ
jgi:hypothetical protein